MPHPPCSPNLAPKQLFFVSLMKKILKGKCFAHVEEVKQKVAKALRGIKIDEFENYFEQCKNILIGVLHQVESTLKVIEV